jgi:small subunit ribosomal protein S21
MSEVKVKGNALDRALKILKKKMSREGTLKELYERQHFVKPSAKKYKKKKLAKYVSKLVSEEDRDYRSKV